LAVKIRAIYKPVMSYILPTLNNSMREMPNEGNTPPIYRNKNFIPFTWSFLDFSF